MSGEIAIPTLTLIPKSRQSLYRSPFISSVFKLKIMEKKKARGKITLGMLKGKPINASVPSIAIRFNATAEEIEELYPSDGEQGDGIADLNQTTVSDVESSPIKSKLSKRSTSVDVSNVSDASPPSDPWRFFTDIKGKITKSVEGKITEYKSRGSEGEGSPKTSKPSGKESSSLSDSEELSESSISKTCGIISTTEGAEMSSDDETPSLSEKEKKDDESLELSAAGTERKIRIVKDSVTTSQGTTTPKFLENLQNINLGFATEDKSDVESGVDALLQLDNVELDGEEVLIKEKTGTEIRSDYLQGSTKEQTVFAPSGFVDLRAPVQKSTRLSIFYRYKVYIICAVVLVVYWMLPLSPYICGFIAGTAAMFSASVLYVNIFFDPIAAAKKPAVAQPILQIPAVKEHEPLTKYEGWMNEYPEKYNPRTYHISQTQAVYLRLQGNLLKISHTRQKIPKRATWNEAEHKMIFTRHRIYNLIGAKVSLLPKGLTKIRHWSKKYPICITLDKNQLNFDYNEKKNRKSTVEETVDSKSKIEGIKNQTHVFSKLCEQSRDADLMSDIEDCANDGYLAPPIDYTENSDADFDIDESLCDKDDELHDCIGDNDADINSSSEFLNVQDDDNKTFIFIFARTSRDKEHWFKRLAEATFKKDDKTDDDDSGKKDVKSAEQMQSDYLKLISKFTQANQIDSTPLENGWLNALLSRVMFDCMRNNDLVLKIKDRIQRKLSSIKLPYFIEELTITELSLGNTTPNIVKVEKPVTDDWGLWVDFDVQYEGHIVVILQTKLNLMKLKEPQSTAEKCNEKSPIFHSDVDDSAESSTDDDAAVQLPTNVDILDSNGQGGMSNKSKRIIKMVDRIAESKFFKAASENKFVKKAMEGVSKTDLRLKVELKSLSGCLVLNIPTPPSDRIWYGFRPSPAINLSAHPIVGERNINFMHVTNWIEKKLLKEFQKILVIPNMEDVYIPVMLQWLTE